VLLGRDEVGGRQVEDGVPAVVDRRQEVPAAVLAAAVPRRRVHDDTDP
jgi:hypothetical protein